MKEAYTMKTPQRQKHAKGVKTAYIWEELNEILETENVGVIA